VHPEKRNDLDKSCLGALENCLENTVVLKVISHRPGPLIYQMTLLLEGQPNHINLQIDLLYGWRECHSYGDKYLYVDLALYVDSKELDPRQLRRLPSDIEEVTKLPNGILLIFSLRAIAAQKPDIWADLWRWVKASTPERSDRVVSLKYRNQIEKDDGWML